MSNKPERLEREDVVSVYSEQILINNRTFILSELIAALMPVVKGQGKEWTEEKEKWFDEGIECKILKPGAKNWKRGKVRFTLEFLPEMLEVAEMPENSELQANKVDSPLDPIRQMIN